ncbi:MAG: hypothetical protein LDL33_08280, partial [Desulfomonile sp.]|nr:hypothetical protein [Desulfomonile sp.]
RSSPQVGISRGTHIHVLVSGRGVGALLSLVRESGGNPSIPEALKRGEYVAGVLYGDLPYSGYRHSP